MHMELMDIIDKNDKVIGQADRKEIYTNKLCHRIVHVLIFDNNGKMLLQQRGKNSNYLPLGWSTSVGGHVKSGETYKQAAKREMEEEIGIKGKIQLIIKEIYQDPRGFDKHLHIYKIISEGPFTPHYHEVEKLEFFTIPEIKNKINKGDIFHPELLFILNKYYFKND